MLFCQFKKLVWQYQNLIKKNHLMNYFTQKVKSYKIFKMKDAKAVTIKNAKLIAKKQGGQVFYSGNVSKHHIKSNGKDERILIITQLFISYFSKKGENTNTNYWIDLRNMIVQKKDKNTLIKLVFDQNEVMTFEYPTKSRIEAYILESIKYMTNGQNIKIEGVDSQINYSILPRSIFNIFLSLVSLNNNNLPKPLKSSIRMICRLHSKVVGFIPEMIDQYFPFLLKSIVNSNYVESFRIPELPNTDVYGSLTEFLKSNNYGLSSIIHLQISKQNMKNFSNFCDAFSKSKSVNNRITALTFSNSELDQDSIKLLSESIINSKWNGGFEVNSIKFDNAVNEGVNFIDSFFPNSTSLKSANSPLKFFSMNRMKISDVGQLISLLKGIRILSLSYMGIEVSSIFQAISNTGMDELNYLNVSGNFLNETVSFAKKLPSSLQRLDMNEVDFLVKNQNSEKGNALIEFFTSILKKKWKTLFYLSFSHIFCHNNNEGPFPPESALQFLFTKLKSLNSSSCQSLKGLSFSGNFINDDFFDFLKKCSNIKSLYLDYCLSQDSPFIDTFCDMIENSLPNLNVLSIKGDVIQNRVIGEYFPTLCKSLKRCKCLQCLIVSDNMIGLKGLQALSKLFDSVIEDDNNENNKDENEEEEEEDKSESNKKTKKKNVKGDNKNYVCNSIKSISFDNCNSNSLMPIMGVAAKAAKIKRSILIDFPTQEVWRLKQQGIADKQQIKELRERLEFIYLRNNESERYKTKHDSDLKPITQYWSKPFTEFKVPTNDFFPEYLSPEINSEIHSPEVAQIKDDDIESESEDEDEEEILNKKAKKKTKVNNADEIIKKMSKKKIKKIDYSDDDSSDQVIDKKKKKKIKVDDESEEEDEEETTKKKKTSPKKKRKIESESDESEEEEITKKKKTNPKKKQKIESESEEEEDNLNKKRKKKKISIESDSESEVNGSQKNRRKSRKNKPWLNSDSEEEEDDDRQSKKSKLKRKNSKKMISDSDSSENNFSAKNKKNRKRKTDLNSEDDDSDIDFMRSRKRIKKTPKFEEPDDDDDYSDEDKNFPLSIDSKKEKKIINSLKKKFSINHLQEEIVNS